MRSIKKKQSKILARKICKDIFKNYRLKPIISSVGTGYFCFSFNGKDINLHFRFKELPGMLFGVWTRGGKIDHIFAEHESFIDKFKWTSTKFDWGSDMDSFVKDVRYWSSDSTIYHQMLVDYYDYTADNEKWYHDNYEFVENHNGIDPHKYKVLDSKFKEYMNNLMDSGMITSYMYTKANTFMDLYDVICFVDNRKDHIDGDVVDDELYKISCHLIFPDNDYIVKKRKWSGFSKWYAVGDINNELWVKRAFNIEKVI